PLRKRGAPRLAYLISAIGASFFLSNLVLVWRGHSYESYPTTVDPSPLFYIGKVPIQTIDFIILGVMVTMLIALDTFVRRSKVGRGIRAVAQDVETAGMMGVDINSVVTTTFLLGGMLAGAAGLLYGIKFSVVRLDIGFLTGIKAFTAGVLGGIGNIRCPMVGGTALRQRESIRAGCFGTQWQDVIAFGVL